MESDFEERQEQLQMSQLENRTLKKLLAGKDSLVLQKTQALDLARHLMEQLRTKDARMGAEVEQLLARTQFVAADPSHKDVTVEIRYVVRDRLQRAEANQPGSPLPAPSPPPPTSTAPSAATARTPSCAVTAPPRLAPQDLGG